MGALPVVLNDLGIDPHQVGKATEPNSNQQEDDISLLDSTGPNTPEQQLSPSPINTTWTLELSSIK